MEGEGSKIQITEQNRVQHKFNLLKLKTYLNP